MSRGSRRPQDRFIAVIADDEPGVRAAIRTILAPYPIRCLEAADGVTAMELIAAHDPHLLIVDYAMPGWDGLEIVRHLRQSGVPTRTKVLFTSGCASLNIYQELIAAHFVDGVLEKPFDVRMLTYQVRMLLGVRAGAEAHMGGVYEGTHHRILERGRLLGDSSGR